MYELVRVKESLEGCMKEKKQKLEELLQVYRGVFHEPKGYSLLKIIKYYIISIYSIKIYNLLKIIKY
jgi:hypothetical protein